MKNSTKKILAFLLCFEMILSMACNAIPVVHAMETDGTEPVCTCPLEDGVHWATCPAYTCPDCGTAGWHETCPVTGDETDAAETPDEEEAAVCGVCGETDCAAEHVYCETCADYDCGKVHAVCETCGEIDCEETHETVKMKSAASANEDCECPMTDGLHEIDCPNYVCPVCETAGWTHDVDKCPELSQRIDMTATFNLDSIYDFVEVSANKPSTNTEVNSLALDAFTNAVFRIEDYTVIFDGYYYNLWYQVTLIEGSAPAEFADHMWFFQNCLGLDPAEDALILSAPEKDACEICGKENCTSSHENWCETCKKDDCGLTHETCEVCGKENCTETHIVGTVTDSEGEELEIVVSGEALPDGASVEVSIPELNETSENFNIFNIKVCHDGEYWQPDAGEVVEVTFPAPAGATSVEVFHFIEDSNIIKYVVDNGLAQIVDVSQYTEDPNYHIIKPAVEGYQKAFDTRDKCVVIEAVSDVNVENGYVTIEANGFSAFTSLNPVIEVENVEFADLWADAVQYYVRLDEWVKFEAYTVLGGIEVDGNGTDYMEEVDSTAQALFGTTSYYIHILNNTDAIGKYILFTNRSVGFFTQKLQLNIVADFDYGNVYIGVVDHNSDYPNEVYIHEESEPDRYLTSSNTLVTERERNRLYPRTLIDVDLLNASNDLEFNESKTVYGLERTSVSILPYLKRTDNVDADGNTYDGLNDVMAAIKTAYFALTANADLEPDDYKVIPYVIKHETIGGNAGWYVNFKIVSLDTYTLSYEYNEPSGFNALDHLGTTKKPNNIDVPILDEDGYELDNVTATVGSGTGMVMSYTDGKTYTANFVGWSTDPNANPATHPASPVSDDNWYEAGETITLTKDTILYAIWTTNQEYTDADVRFTKRVTTDAGKSFETLREFSFIVDSKFSGLKYQIFDEAGQAVGTGGAFATSALRFTLKANHYIVIYDVPNHTNPYVITEENVPPGYTAPNGGKTSVQIDSGTNKSGEFRLEYTNQINTYDVTFVTDGGLSVIDITDYTVETEIQLPTTKKTGYTFTGWKVTTAGGNWTESAVISKDDLQLSAGKYGDVTLTAQWTVNTYKIVFEPDNGIDEDWEVFYDFGDKIDQLDVPTTNKTGHSFAGWAYVFEDELITFTDKDGKIDIEGLETEFTMPASDITLIAQWTPTLYTIKFVNWNGAELQSDEVAYGETPVYTGATPTKASTAQYSYTFDGWEPAIVAVTGDATYKATFKSSTRTYTVTWEDDDGTPLETDTNVPYGTKPTYDGATPTKAADAQFAYTFVGWTPEIKSVTGDMTYTATYTETVNKYTITFVDEDGTTVLKEATEYAYGTSAADIVKPADPADKVTPQYTYTFKGWSPAVADVTEDVIYKATYSSTVNKYTVTWVVDGNETTEIYEYGATPSFKGSTDKAADAQYTYTFAGWSPAVADVTGNVTYTATYSSTVNSYTVTWIVDGKTTTETYEYGATPSFKGSTDKAADTLYAYDFAGWDPEIAEVTGETTYTATYTKTLRAANFTITRSNAKKGDIFVYRVTGNGLSIDVTLVAGEDGNGSVTIKDLPFTTETNKYTVTQLNDWSWRYSDAARADIDHKAADGVTFNGTASTKWLSGLSSLFRNIFGNATPVKKEGV